MRGKAGGVTMCEALDRQPVRESLDQIKRKVGKCLRKLYDLDKILFERNGGRGVCERCMVFRFAMYLQEAFPGFSVDCDFNSAAHGGQPVSGKPIANRDGTTTKRFVDIIVHRRATDGHSDFICFEVKKWNNNCRRDSVKDQSNLRGLTSEYRYRYGFHLILGKSRSKTRWTIFEHGEVLTELTPVFEDFPDRCVARSP
jgi:hypothetical protein